MLHFSKLRTVLLALAFSALGSTAVQAETKVHWYGQSAFRIDTPSGGVILIDPWLKVPSNPDKESIEKLGRVDYILITHAHFDHVGNAIEIAKKTGAELIATSDLARNLVALEGYPKDKVKSGLD